MMVKQNKPKVIFKFNKERDAWNIWDTANSKNRWGHDFTKNLNQELVEKLRGKKWQVSKKYLSSYLEEKYLKNKEPYNEKLKEIEKTWKKIEKEYFKRLSKITKKKIYKNKFMAYITTIGRCPYFKKENAFMININNSINNIMNITAHEVMHLQFHYYFEEKLRKKISHEKFEDLKESLTVLLNLEFKDILPKEDEGYPKHQELRDFIINGWKKEKDFDVLLDKCVEYLKKIDSF